VTGRLFDVDAYVDSGRVELHIWDTLGELRNGRYRLAARRQPDGTWAAVQRASAAAESTAMRDS